MRILRCIQTADPRSGGPLEGLRQSALLHARDGHETELVTVDDPAAPWVASFPFKVHATGPGRGRVYGHAPAYTRWVARNAARYDGVVIHGLWTWSSVGAWRALRRSGQPYLVFVHGMMDPYFAQGRRTKNLLKQIYWWLGQGAVLRDAAAVLFTSAEEMARAEGAFIGPRYAGRVIAYGSPPVADAPQQQAAAFRRALPQLAGRRHLLFLSRLHPKKGCDLLIRAFAPLAKQHPDLDLVMAGPDQVGWREQLEALAREHGIEQRVHWPDMLEGDAKSGAFRTAEAFVLPSHQENFGIVVAEALACGTPVLITDKVNIWREVEAGGAGLVAPDTLPGTTDNLTRFLALDDSARAAMRQAALATYARHFSIERAADQLIEVLEEVRDPRR